MTMPSHMLLKRSRKHYWNWNGKFSRIQLIHQILPLLIIVWF